MCASSCYYSGNKWLKNIQASTPLFTDVLEGASKNEDLFESLIENVCTYNIKTCAGVNIGPMGQPLKNTKIDIKRFSMNS